MNNLQKILNGDQEYIEINNTAIIKNKYVEIDKLKELLKYRNSVDLFWKDIIFIFIDIFQIFSLCWVCNWNWPLMWKDYTFVLNIFNFEIFGIYDYFAANKVYNEGGSTNSSLRSEWGEMDYYLLYVMFYIIVLLFLIA